MIPKVTVIVPIYNVEPYLPRCLDSLCRQTLQEIEIILVDDGSTDASGRIAEDYARRDDRFRVVHQENRGLSAARNRGIELAQAPYLSFDAGGKVSQRGESRPILFRRARAPGRKPCG